MATLAALTQVTQASALALGLAAAAVAVFTPAAARAQQALDGRDVAVASPPAQIAAPPPSTPADPPQRRAHRRHPQVEGGGGEEGAPADKGPAFKEYLRLHAGPVTIEPVVLMQVQGIPYVGAGSTVETGDPADRAGFRFRRARFGFEGRLFHRVPFSITAEFNSDVKGKAQLHDASFGYDRFKFLEVKVGLQDVPFSRYAITGAGEGALIERPFAVRAMAPFHQLGGVIQGHLFSGGLNYHVGIYNGLQRNDQFFQGYVENAAILGNRFDGLTYAGRLTSEPLGSLGRSIEDLYHDKLRIAAGASAFYSDGGTRGVLGLGGDILLHVRGFHLMGEFLANRSTPKTSPTQPTTQTATVTSFAAVGEAGYVIWRERLGITARFEWLNPNTAVSDESDSWVAGGGASYHILHDFLKAQLDFMHREEIHGKPLKNDSLVFQLQLNL